MSKQRNVVDWDSFYNEVRNKPCTFPQLLSVFRRYNGRNSSNLRRWLKKMRDKGKVDTRYYNQGHRIHAVYWIK